MSRVTFKGSDFNQANIAKAKIDAKSKPHTLTKAESEANYKRAGWIKGPGGGWLPPALAPFNVGEFDITKLEIDGVTLKDELRETLTSAKANFTIEGASTVVLAVEDPTRALISSGLFHETAILDLNSFKYRLVKVSKQADNFQLTFEDELVNKLRRRGAAKGHRKKWLRGKYTRAQVIYDLVKEVTPQHNIFIPVKEFFKPQPIEPPKEETAPKTRSSEKSLGFPPNVKFEVKTNSQSTPAQVRAAQEMLEEGVSMKIDRKGLVMGIMAAIQESNLNTEFNSNPSSEGVGILSQIKHYGWPATGNVKTDSHEFFKRLKQTEISGKHYSTYGEQINAVQASADARLYDAWKSAAEHIVELFTGSGNLPKTLSSKTTQKVERPYYFERKNEEDSWTCIQRLASEVQWRAFVVRGIFYFISEEDLLKSGPIRLLSEFEPDSGIDWIDYEKDQGQAFQTGKIIGRAHAWDILPGSMIEVKDEGPAQGLWLVYNVEVDLFRMEVEITINAAIEPLPEKSTFESIERKRKNPGGSKPGGGQYGGLIGSNATFAGPDQGIDFTGKAPMFALDDAHITRVGYNTGWSGEGNIIVMQFTAGKHKGRYCYYAEDLRPTVKEGQDVERGAEVAEATGSGKAPGVECGFAQNAHGSAYGSTSDGKGGNPPNPEAIKFKAYVEEQSHG